MMGYPIDQPVYLGRVQQGQELPLALQCVDATGAPADPVGLPVATFYRDGATKMRIETRPIAADLRGVKAGAFRLSLFLGELYTTGRHLIVFRWADQNGVPHCQVATFMLLPGGSPDGAVIALKYVERPDSRYLMWQTDAGRLLRGRNPR